MDDTNAPVELDPFDGDKEGSGMWTVPVFDLPRLPNGMVEAVSATTSGSAAFVLCRGKSKDGQPSQLLDRWCPAYISRETGSPCSGCAPQPNAAGERCFYRQQGLRQPQVEAHACGHSYCPPLDPSTPLHQCWVCALILEDRLRRSMLDRQQMFKERVLTAADLQEKVRKGDDDGGGGGAGGNDGGDTVTEIEINLTRCKDKLASYQ